MPLQQARKSRDHVVIGGALTPKPSILLTCVARSAGSGCISHRICLLAAAFWGLPPALGYAADFNQYLKPATPVIVVQATGSKGTKSAPQASPVAPNATGAEIVGRMLSPGPSDPDVPLPRGDLASRPSIDGPLDRPTIYGRQEEGGGVLGLKIPIPADRNASDRRTRSGIGGAGAD